MKIFPLNENKGKFFRSSALIISLLFLAVVGTTLAFFIFNNTKNINESVYSLENAELEKTSINISGSFNEVAEMSSYLSTMEPYVEDLFSPHSDYASFLIIKNQMNSYLSLFDQINNIYIKTPTGNEFTINGVFPEIDFESHKVGKLKNSYISVVPNMDAYNTIFFGLTPNNISHANNEVYISVNSIALGQGKLAYDSYKREYLLDSKGTIISAYDMSEIGENFSTLHSIKDFKVSDGQRELKINKNNYILTVDKLDNLDIYAVSITDKDYYSAYYSSGIGLTALISVIILTVGILVCAALTQFYYKPIRDILNQIGQYQEIIISKNVNEVEYINKYFDQMHQSNVVLDEKASKALKDLKTWNIAALQAQICPHFLYNTLDAINWLAYKHLSKDNEISKATRHMAYIMRLSMDITRMFCTISEEINITKRYIEIVDIRSNNRFDISWNVDQKCLDCAIPRLCIQPMIENAVTHAFPDSTVSNEIVITVKESSGDIEISVEDNGTGISQYDLNKLRANIKSENYDGNNVGLRNINQRCKIIFGDEYGITIKSVVGKGSKFTLRIPKDKQ